MNGSPGIFRYFPAEGIPYLTCNNPGGDYYWVGGRSKVFILVRGA